MRGFGFTGNVEELKGIYRAQEEIWIEFEETQGLSVQRLPTQTPQTAQNLSLATSSPSQPLCCSVSQRRRLEKEKKKFCEKDSVRRKSQTAIVKEKENRMGSVLLSKTSPFSDNFHESREQNDNVVQPAFDKSNDCRSKEEVFNFSVVL